MVDWFILSTLALVFIGTFKILHDYSSKKTPYFVNLMVFIGFFNSFVIVILIPYDVYLSTGGEGNKNLLYVCWLMLYWNIFTFCWVVLPIMSSYYSSAEFKFWTRLKQAVIKEIKFFFIIAGVACGFILYLYITQHLSLAKIPEVLILMNNLWGLLLIVIMLGYGLVSIPRYFWNKGNLKKTLSNLQMKAPIIEDAKGACKYEIKKKYKDVLKIMENIKNNKEFQSVLEIIFLEFPKDVVKEHRSDIKKNLENFRKTEEKISEEIEQSKSGIQSKPLKNKINPNNKEEKEENQISYKELVKLYGEVKGLVAESERIQRYQFI